MGRKVAPRKWRSRHAKLCAAWGLLARQCVIWYRPEAEKGGGLGVAHTAGKGSKGGGPAASALARARTEGRSKQQMAEKCVCCAAAGCEQAAREGCAGAGVKKEVHCLSARAQPPYVGEQGTVGNAGGFLGVVCARGHEGK